jgi:hypothetical protein
VVRVGCCVITFCAIGLTGGAFAQSFERIPYSAPADWTVTTYRSKDSGAFLRCSAERHYEDGTTLTVARNAEGNFVLGFTSGSWTFEDQETTGVRVQVDANEVLSTTGRGRRLPTGPMLFVDVDAGTTAIDELSKGNQLRVTTGGTTLTMSLHGSAAAIASVIQCQSDGTDE